MPTGLLWHRRRRTLSDKQLVDSDLELFWFMIDEKGWVLNASLIREEIGLVGDVSGRW